MVSYRNGGFVTNCFPVMKTTRTLCQSVGTVGILLCPLSRYYFVPLGFEFHIGIFQLVSIHAYFYFVLSPDDDPHVGSYRISNTLTSSPGKWAVAPFFPHHIYNSSTRPLAMFCLLCCTRRPISSSTIASAIFSLTFSSPRFLALLDGTDLDESQEL